MATRIWVCITGKDDSDGDTDLDWSGRTEVMDRGQRPSGLEAHRGVASPGTGCRARSVSRKADGKWTGTGQRTAARPMSPLHKLEKERVRTAGARSCCYTRRSGTGIGHGQCPQPNTRCKQRQSGSWSVNTADMRCDSDTAGRAGTGHQRCCRVNRHRVVQTWLPPSRYDVGTFLNRHLAALNIHLHGLLGSV